MKIFLFAVISAAIWLNIFAIKCILSIGGPQWVAWLAYATVVVPYSIGFVGEAIKDWKRL